MPKEWDSKKMEQSCIKNGFSIGDEVSFGMPAQSTSTLVVLEIIAMLYSVL